MEDWGFVDRFPPINSPWNDHARMLGSGFETFCNSTPEFCKARIWSAQIAEEPCLPEDGTVYGTPGGRHLIAPAGVVTALRFDLWMQREEELTQERSGQQFSRPLPGVTAGVHAAMVESQREAIRQEYERVFRCLWRLE